MSQPVPRRQILIGGAGLVAASAAASCTRPTTDPLRAAVDDLVSQLDPAGPYRPPTPEEIATAGSALGLLQDGAISSAEPKFGSLGFSIDTGTDTATGRRFALAVGRQMTDRSWGLIAIDLSTPARLVVQIPHPRADVDTEIIGLSVFRRVPGSILMIAGAHRRTAAGAADVAHRSDSLFHAFAIHLGAQGLRQMQLHGYADSTVPGTDLVLSAGAGFPDDAARSAADALTAAGFAVCRSWTRRCTLEGRANAQGRAAASRGWPFLHLEMNRTVRGNTQAREQVIHSLAETFRSTA